MIKVYLNLIDFFNFLTGVSTFVLAATAIYGLNHWREKLKIDDKLHTLNTLQNHFNDFVINFKNYIALLVEIQTYLNHDNMDQDYVREQISGLNNNEFREMTSFRERLNKLDTQFITYFARMLQQNIISSDDESHKTIKKEYFEFQDLIAKTIEYHTEILVAIGDKNTNNIKDATLKNIKEFRTKAFSHHTKITSELNEIREKLKN